MADINIRELVAESLLQMEREEVFLSVMEKDVLDKYDYMDPRDKAFYKRVLSGTVERKIRIDYILGLFSNIKVNKMKPYIRAVLRLSVYQIMWMDSVPDSAACNEAVKLVVKKGMGGLKGFVNGVLRSICRNRDSIKYPDPEKNPVKYMSVYYSCPEWIVSKFIDENGKETAALILEDSCRTHAVSLRMRTSEKETERLKAAWIKSGAEVKTSGLLPYAVSVSGIDGVKNLEGYNEGAFIVQDVGAMLVAELAGIKPGNTVLDLCAAPGGKSIHAADILKKLGGGGHVFSFDVSEEKCEKIRENAERLGLDNISVNVHDATVYMEETEGKADVVIVDAPCSGLGVIGHKSDIKYRLKAGDIEALSNLQRRILDNAVKYLKKGGRLVYSTCTVSVDENAGQKEYLMEKYGLTPVLNENGRDDISLIPGRDDSDGFYITVLTRNADD